QQGARDSKRRAVLLLDGLRIARLGREGTRGADEGVGVEEIVDHVVAAAVTARNLLAVDKGVLAIEGAVHSNVETAQEGHRRAALGGHDSRERPSSGQGV